MDTIRLSAVGCGSGSLEVQNSVCFQGGGHQGLHVIHVGHVYPRRHAVQLARNCAKILTANNQPCDLHVTLLTTMQSIITRHPASSVCRLTCVAAR